MALSPSKSSLGRRVVLASIICGMGMGMARGQDESDTPDKVIINPGGRSSTRITLKGEILDYTGETLRIRLKLGETPREFPAADVVEIVTSQANWHQKGLDLFAAQDYAGATSAFEDAFKDESRAWVKREILTYLVRCALKRGDYTTATAKFAFLVRSDPKTHSFPLIPLIWTKQAPNAALKSQAQGWLADEKQPVAVRLMGASIMLEDSEFGAAASIALRDLAAQSDRRVGVLAACQQWRTRLATSKEINLTELKAWGQKLESLPEELQSGPRFLMGQAYVSRREFELAAVYLLWTPLVQPDDHLLAAKATLDAADALTKIGQLEEAARLYEEISARYTDTVTAKEAASRLQELLKQADQPSSK